MKTPKEYSRNLANGIITPDMLRDCLFSTNKRAKNCRDQERAYRNGWDYYDNEEKYREKKEEYYRQKELLLTLLKPQCIHKELLGYERRRIYDYETDYQEHLKAGDFVRQNRYFERDIEDSGSYEYDDFYNQEGHWVYFGDVELKDKPRYHYYLFYDMGQNSFHSPIAEEDIANYDLPVIAIDHLDTHGHEITDLISAQFVKKVLSLIESGKYKYAA